jgi:hypothetical protein
VALLLFFISGFFQSFNPFVKAGLGTLLIFVFLGTVYAFEKKDLKGLFKLNKKK